MAKKSTLKIKILALIFFIVIFAGLLVFLFSGDNFVVLNEIFNTNATKEQIQQSISKLGFRSYLVVGILAMLQVILTFIPAEPLHVISGVSFGLGKGMLVCFIGILLGNTIIYILYKIFGTKLTDYFASNVNFDFESAKLSNKIALIVIILYCLPAIPYGIICFFAATVKMKYPKYILITGIGSIPSLLLDVGLGHLTMETSWIISIIVFVVIIILLILMYIFKKQIFEKINKLIKRSHEKSKNKVGKFNYFVYQIGCLFCYIGIRRKVRFKKINNVGKLTKPCIILCNHGSFYDFIYSGTLIRKYHPHFIVARLYFHNKYLGWILNKTGAFPKSMFTTDVESSKNCLKVINSKQVLAMMPEARLSTIGKFEDIQETTYKFLQKIDVPVYTIKLNGSYLAKPKWADSLRKGSLVEVELNPLFNQGEAKNLTLQEVKTRVDNALYYDEWQWLKNHPDVKYKHKNIAKGLENILCICPNCLQKYSFETDKNNIICTNCGLNIKIDNRYQLSNTKFENIAQWYEWQTEQFKTEIESNIDFCIESNVELKHLDKNKKISTQHSGYGICKLNKNGLLYKGTEDGNEIEKLFPLDTIYRLLFGAGEDFEIYEDKQLYYFVPENKKSCVAWYIISGLLKQNN